MKKILFLLLFIFLLSLDNVFALNEKTTIRVGLSNQNFSVFEHQSQEFICENTIKITDLQNNIEIKNIEANTPVKITMEEGVFKIYKNEELIYETQDGIIVLSSNKPIGILNLNRKGTPARYSGMIELRKTKNGDKFHTINVVNLDDYLKGSVPNEMPVSFGLEALKAQAIAAKNYVTKSKISEYYDVVDSTQSQVYYGYNSNTDISNKAVDETKGIYALYNQQPISALYFSTSPGITDNWSDVFGTPNTHNPYPYLKARYDNPYQKPLNTEKDVQEFYSSKAGGFDTNSPKYRWSLEYSKDELENTLKNTLFEQSKTGNVMPKLNSPDDFKDLIDIKPIKRTQSGKIIELEILAQSGNYKVKRELSIRKLFKKENSFLPSANFYIETTKAINEDISAPIPTKENIFSTIDDIFTIKNNPVVSYKLIGGGFGHGVGMSQFGAYHLSKSGKKFPYILKHYYSGITLGTLVKSVNYNEYNMSYKTDFYFNPNTFKTVNLYVKNPKKASEFPFKINNYDFSDTKEMSANFISKMDITQYLKTGLNTISFKPLSLNNKGKTVEYRIEFQ